MKTILSLSAITAIAALFGLLPLALAESNEKAPGGAPSAAAEKDAGTQVGASEKSPAASAPGRKAPSGKSATRSKAKAPDGTAPAPVATLDLTPTQEDKLLTLLNEGTVEDLDAIPGIAMTRADSIVSARPYASVHEIILVEGVGNATFEKILAFGKTLTQRGNQAGQPVASSGSARKS